LLLLAVVVRLLVCLLCRVTLCEDDVDLVSGLVTLTVRTLLVADDLAGVLTIALDSLTTLEAVLVVLLLGLRATLGAVERLDGFLVLMELTAGVLRVEAGRLDTLVLELGRREAV
jgi:hypothetical protein